MADPARKRRAGGGARSNSGHPGPPRAAPRPPERPPSPRAAAPAPPPPACTTRAPAARARGMLLNLLAVSYERPSQHALEAGAAPGPCGGRPRLASALGRRGRR